MAVNNFILNTASNVFRDVFGQVITPKLLNVPQRNKTTANRFGTNIYKSDQYGVECFCPVTLTYGDEELFLPYSTVSISGSKKIESTPLINRKGTIDEYISLNSWQIRIKGVIVSRTDELPEDDLAALNEIYTTQQEVNIINPVTDFYLTDDQSIIIKSLELPDMQGISYAQAFVMNCKSDDNLELIVE
jgi:hypothetical protein